MGRVKRSRLVLTMVVAVVVAAAGGWMAGRSIQSPAEAAAQSAEPEPSPILVPAEVRELSTDIITRGTARFGSPMMLSLATSQLKADAGVATSLPAVGEELGEGDVFLTVSGRPVFLLGGDVPSYRDLGPGLEGPDVLQLEESLMALDLDPGSIDGMYDDATGSAVTRLYRRAGFDPIAATEEQLAEVTSVAAALVGSVPGPGVLVPADEIVFMPVTPVRITEVTVGRGEAIEGAILTLSDASVRIDASVPIESASLVREGMPVRIDEPDLGIDTQGLITFVAPGPGTNEVDGFHVYMEVEVPTPPSNLVNASVRLTIATDSTDGPVLAVPIAALTLGADGSSRVQVQRAGQLIFLEVQPGLSADGYVAVTPLTGALGAGDLVVVGFERPAG